mmetsp:Transcript_49798/g.142471  ORF Transcript_49798/g.142471 Transcript_49798/m.142471 type:complete len:226 (+) Transcript_49798:531-1208(+)
MVTASCRRRRSGTCATSTPSRRTQPASGVTIRSSASIHVDLPEPVRPMRPVRAPPGTAKETPSRTSGRCGLKRTLTPSKAKAPWAGQMPSGRGSAFAPAGACQSSSCSTRSKCARRSTDVKWFSVSMDCWTQRCRRPRSPAPERRLRPTRAGSTPGQAIVTTTIASITAAAIMLTLYMSHGMSACRCRKKRMFSSALASSSSRIRAPRPRARIATRPESVSPKCT